MSNSGVFYRGERAGRYLFWLLFVLLITLPLLWVLSVSLQPPVTVLGGRYTLLPQPGSFQAYELAIIENYRGIRSSLAYSLLVSAVATAIAIVVALSAAYLVNARVLTLLWRRRIVQGAIGLFFLPAFAVYPGVQLLGELIPLFQQTLIQLIVVHSIQAFPIALILLLSLFASLSGSDFEQLLLETESRVKAFWWGVVARKPAGILSVATVMFAAIWSEYYLTSLITTKDQNKPFSVLLQMFDGQYRTDYASLAAGAVISLMISLGSVAFGAWVVGVFRKVRDLSDTESN